MNALEPEGEDPAVYVLYTGTGEGGGPGYTGIVDGGAIAYGIDASVHTVVNPKAFN